MTMATYKEIQAAVRQSKGRTPKNCWIADVLAEHGLTRRLAYNRIDPAKRKVPCPEKWRPVIKEALRRLGMIGPSAKRVDTAPEPAAKGRKRK
jgi:hypothetical protein